MSDFLSASPDDLSPPRFGSGPGRMSGIELCRRFYEEAVRPALEASSPGLPHSAALLGRGSEVQGFDDEMSTDHDWRARVVIFVAEDDRTRLGDGWPTALREQIPDRFADRPTDLTVTTVQDYVAQQLLLDLTVEIQPRDWISLPEQALRMITAGAVFHDDVGLQDVRDRLAYYPDDVWRYLLAAGWWRVHPELNLVGRTGVVGDELGSALIGSRLVHDLMHLCFLMERQYAPYPKWFGTAFARLDVAPELSPLLHRTLRAATWPEREEALIDCYRVVAARHDALGLTDPVPTEMYRIWQRPFRVFWGDFPGALLAGITDPAVRRIAEEWPAGGVDQIRDVLGTTRRRPAILRLLGSG